MAWLPQPLDSAYNVMSKSFAIRRWATKPFLFHGAFEKLSIRYDGGATFLGKWSISLLRPGGDDRARAMRCEWMFENSPLVQDAQKVLSTLRRMAHGWAGSEAMLLYAAEMVVRFSPVVYKFPDLESPKREATTICWAINKEWEAETKNGSAQAYTSARRINKEEAVNDAFRAGCWALAGTEPPVDLTCMRL